MVYEDEAVKFYGRYSDSEYCQCDCCTSIGRVAIIGIPITRYSQESNYTNKETGYRKMWMCDDCREALTRLLNRLGATR